MSKNVNSLIFQAVEVLKKTFKLFGFKIRYYLTQVQHKNMKIQTVYFYFYNKYFNKIMNFYVQMTDYTQKEHLQSFA